MRVSLDITLTSPLHHGAGNAGNTALLRTEEIITGDGSPASVPYVSANSVRHMLRESLAWHTLHTLAVEGGSLTKAAVDLLFTGGAITSTGAQVDLGMARRVEETYPALGLLGYSAQSDIVAGTLRVGSLMLVCAENAWRLPPGIDGGAHATRRSAAYRSETFGTRHDVSGTAVDRYLAAVVEIAQPTTQMIYDMQTLKPGSRLAGEVTLTPAATDAHARILRAAFALVAPSGDTARAIALGAKNAVGFGSGIVTGLPDGDADLDWWTGYLSERRDDVLALIADLSS